MKKLTFLLILISLFILGCAEVHTESPIIVKGIKASTNTSHIKSYEVELSCSHKDLLLMYTDKLYSVGDTIQ